MSADVAPPTRALSATTDVELVGKLAENSWKPREQQCGRARVGGVQEDRPWPRTILIRMLLNEVPQPPWSMHSLMKLGLLALLRSMQTPMMKWA